MDAAKTDIPLLKGENGQSLFKDTSYIDSAVIDNAVFFNTDHSKCLVLVLQQTSKILYLDQVLIVHGTFINGNWRFKPDRFPPVPKIIYTVSKSGTRDKPTNNSFEALSKKACQFILNEGRVDSFGCAIDKDYWFGSQ